MDDINWDHDRYSHIIGNIKPFLKEAGYDTEKNVFWVPIAG
jgi:translation elongation factor EF-1alpha